MKSVVYQPTGRYSRVSYLEFARMLAGLQEHLSESDRLKVASEIERIFREDNPRFDSAVFMKACNVPHKDAC